MAKTKSTEPVVTRGSHSTRTEYPDGRVVFETHWDELKRDVEAALASVATQTEPKKKVKEPVAKKTVKETKSATSAKKAPAKKTATKAKVEEAPVKKAKAKSTKAK